jgi:hypothetical protein
MNTQSFLHPQVTAVHSTKSHLQLSQSSDTTLLTTKKPGLIRKKKHITQYLNLYQKTAFQTLTAESGTVTVIHV